MPPALTPHWANSSGGTADMVTPGFIPVLERVPSDGVSTRYQSEYPVLERVPGAGASTQSRSHHPVLEPVPGAGLSTRCRSESPVLEPSPGAGVSTRCGSQYTVPEPSPGPGAVIRCDEYLLPPSQAQRRSRPHRAWPSLRASPTEPAPCLGVCPSPWLKPTGYKIGHASGINSALAK